MRLRKSRLTELEITYDTVPCMLFVLSNDLFRVIFIYFVHWMCLYSFCVFLYGALGLRFGDMSTVNLTFSHVEHELYLSFVYTFMNSLLSSFSFTSVGCILIGAVFFSSSVLTGYLPTVISFLDELTFTGRRVLNDRPQLANQTVKTRHISLVTESFIRQFGGQVDRTRNE